ncbi:MAG TPA: YfjI family protein [Ktedonobacterales bacterium]|nr:YfjI family protein [Ktedonobacterales bacterium]
MAAARRLVWSSSADGHQTLAPPPSRHPDGETYIWDERGDPAHVDAAVLCPAVARVAAGALIARAWPGVGSRDDAALALTGWLLRAGWTVGAVDRFVLAVAKAAGDEEARCRAKGTHTREALDARDAHVYGKPRLAEVLADGANVVELVEKWLAFPTARTSASASDGEWDEPVPLPEGMPAVDAFDMALMPKPLRGWVHDIGERMWVPTDFLAVGALVVAGALVGRRIGIHPKRHDDWLVVPNLWGAVVALPSLLKSPALAEVLKPLERLAFEALEEYRSQCAEYAANAMVAEARNAAIQERMKKAAKAGNEAELADLAAQVRELEQPKPVPRRFKTNDATVEKLAELLLDNPSGLLVHRDELSGWLRTLDKQGHEGDRAFYLEAWNGTGSFNVDRIGRGSLAVPALCLSLLGGIQPGPLASYVYAASSADNADNDGLLQRFQLLVWPDGRGPWKNVDRWPDSQARSRAYDVLRRLANLAAEQCGATVPEGEPDAIPALRFSDDAQQVFDTWREQLEHRLRSDEMPVALKAHLGKYRSLMPSLALLFHLPAVADDADGVVADGNAEVGVSRSAAQMAAAWCEYLESHAQRLYASASHPALERAWALMRRIASGDVVDGCAVRDVYRKQWSQLSTPDEVDSAIKTLEAYGWVRTAPVETGGRRSTALRVHPQLQPRKRGNA